MKDSITIEIIDKVSEEEGTNPTEMRPPLYETIDTEALEKLFQENEKPTSEVVVEFSYLGYRVSVNEAGEVEITDSDATADSDPSEN